MNRASRLRASDQAFSDDVAADVERLASLRRVALAPKP